MTKKVNIPPKKWVQIGGDVNYEHHGLIIANYDPDFEEVKVVEISPPTDDLKTFHGQEATFDLSELEIHSLKEFGLEPETYKKHGLELIAEELLTTQGGNPIECGAGGFVTDLRSEFKTFDTALACAIGEDESFESWKRTKIKPNKGNIRK